MKIRCMNCMKEYEDIYELCPHCGFVRSQKPKEAYMLCPEMMLADRYVIGTVVGFGGFGTIYRAWDTKLEAMVAIKEYYPSGLVNRIPGHKEVILYTGSGVQEYKKGMYRFLEEARNTAKFNHHENIVHVYDFFEENQTAYLVMEYLDGVNLRQYLKENGGKIGVEETIHILLSVIGALKAVHSEGILHRDISPDNIFVCKNGQIKLMDFGAARFSTGQDEKTLSIVLKPGYAPPEQYQSRSKQGAWTDIYALGATMYRAITGVVPDESVNRQVEDNLKRPREIDSQIPEYIDACLTRAMSLEPELRFQTVKEFEDAILAKKRVRSEKEELKRRKKSRIITASLVGAMILAGAGYGYFMYHQKQVAAQLEEAKVTVWIPVPDDKEISTYQDMYVNMLQEFGQEYQQVSVVVKCIKQSTYDDRLEEAKKEGNLPTLFQNRGLTDLECADVSDLISLIDAGQYYYLNDYDKYYPKHDAVPLGLILPVEYQNTGDQAEREAENSKTSFLSGADSLYIGGSDEYFEIQEELPGMYEITALPENTESKAVFTDEWSVNANADKSEIAAAKRILYYWLGENAQDILHIQNEGALPINRNMFSVYADVNQEMAFLTNEVEKREAKVLKAEDLAAYYEELYQQLQD